MFTKHSCCLKQTPKYGVRHFGPRTLQTQHILATSDWCRNVRTVRHQCQSVSQTLRHWYRTVSTSSKYFCYSRSYRRKVWQICSIVLCGVCRSTTAALRVHRLGADNAKKPSGMRSACARRFREKMKQPTYR